MLGFLLYPVLIGVVLAHVHRSDDGSSAWSHYTYLIHTFWLGLVYAAGCVFLAYAMLPPHASLLWPIPMAIWWAARCALGLSYTWRERPISAPRTWLFPG